MRYSILWLLCALAFGIAVIAKSRDRGGVAPAQIDAPPPTRADPGASALAPCSSHPLPSTPFPSRDPASRDTVLSEAQLLSLLRERLSLLRKGNVTGNTCALGDALYKATSDVLENGKEDVAIARLLLRNDIEEEIIDAIRRNVLLTEPSAILTLFAADPTTAERIEGDLLAVINRCLRSPEGQKLCHDEAFVEQLLTVLEKQRSQGTVWTLPPSELLSNARIRRTMIEWAQVQDETLRHAAVHVLATSEQEDAMPFLLSIIADKGRSNVERTVPLTQLRLSREAGRKGQPTLPVLLRHVQPILRAILLDTTEPPGVHYTVMLALAQVRDPWCKELAIERVLDPATPHREIYVPALQHYYMDDLRAVEALKSTALEGPSTLQAAETLLHTITLPESDPERRTGKMEVLIAIVNSAVDPLLCKQARDLVEKHGDDAARARLAP